MKKLWKDPRIMKLSTKDTYFEDDTVQCKNSICISKCEVCGGCFASELKLKQCSYYKNLPIKVCENLENGGCKLPIS